MNAGNTILLVEDDCNYAFALRRQFKVSGITYCTVVTENGIEAVDWLSCTGIYHDRDKSLVPLLVLSDLQMPRMDGYDLLLHIRANEITKRLPIVIMSSTMSDIIMQKCLENGAKSCIEKDYGLRIAQEIQRVLRTLDTI